jgi:predicted permease
MLDRLRIDTVSAIRALTSKPGPVIWSVLTLGVAVGLNLAMFGLVDRALLSPPAHVASPDRVFTLGFERIGDENGGRMTTTSVAAFDAISRNVQAASHVAAFQRTSTGAVIDSTQLRVDAMVVSGTYFQLLGVRPLVGRGLLPEEDAASAVAPVVLSHAFWTRVFGADPAAIGRRLSVRGLEFTVAGVMPSGFGGHAATRVDVWIPVAAAMQQTPGWQTDSLRNLVSIVVRLKDGETPAAAAAQATAALEASGRRVALSPIVGAGISAVEQRIVYWLTGVSIVVLIIGLANTATLLLVRAARRRRELAIRAALGGTRARLFTQTVVESTLLACAGIGVSLVLAHWFDEIVRRALLPSVVESAGISVRVLAAAAAAGLLALAVASVVGLLQLPSYFRAADLAGAARGNPRRRVHTGLLVLQTTLSVVLLAGAGVFGRSLYNLVTQDFGMRMTDVVLVEFDRGPGSPQGLGDLLRGAVEGIRALPGVDRATIVNVLPFSGFHVPPISVPGHADPPSVNGQLPFLIPTTPGLLEILDLRAVQGRSLTEADGRGAAVVMVNETMAQNVWPGESAVGKCIRIGFDPSFDPFTNTGPPVPSTNLPCREVVGVVRDVRQRSVLPNGTEEHLMQYFVPFSQVPPPPGRPGMQADVWGVLLRTNARVDQLADPIRRLVAGGRPDLPFLQVRPYAALMERQMRPWRLGTILLTLFGALALGVAAMGLYAVYAHVVYERRHEMAVRIAIGAKPAGVLLMIVREAAGLASIGVLCGSAIALLAGRWVQSMLFGTATSDPLVLGAAGSMMLIVAALATFVPALNAARTDPNALLRAE